jgi:hypothetical protein
LHKPRAAVLARKTYDDYGRRAQLIAKAERLIYGKETALTV